MKRLLTILFILSLFSAGTTFGQGRNTSYDINSKLKAQYIYNFAKFADWPATYKQGNFVIGVIGGTNVYNELVKLYSSKRIGSQPIEIKKYASASDVNKCHVLFLDNSKSNQLPQLVSRLKGKSTLIVTEKEGLIHEGASINFFIRSNKLAYELNKTEANNRKLIIGKTLGDLAAKRIE